MQEIYADLHIHIGRAGNQAVKITASSDLTLDNIIFRDAHRKGLDMVGIVDTGSLAVTAELEAMLERGELEEIPKGGFLASNGLVLIAGCESESREGVHLISYLPDLQSIKAWQKYLQPRVHNMNLSTQRANMEIRDFIHLTQDLNGIFCPAHAFTPHKGVYGVWTDKLAPRLGADFDSIRVVELGLSADTNLAELLQETAHFTLLSNSDAHSAINIGREYNLLQMQASNFTELKSCLEGHAGRKVLANYGLDPRLGKYHRSFCPRCDTISDDPPPVRACRHCGAKNIIMGVYDRIMEIKDYDQPLHISGRPDYKYRVPLMQIPGLGPKTYKKLLDVYDNEIEVLEKVPFKDLAGIIGPDLAIYIQNMRLGRLAITPGGGGKYGKVKKNHCE